jgi:hypothetical protein
MWLACRETVLPDGSWHLRAYLSTGAVRMYRMLCAIFHACEKRQTSNTCSCSRGMPFFPTLVCARRTLAAACSCVVFTFCRSKHVASAVRGVGGHASAEKQQHLHGSHNSPSTRTRVCLSRHSKRTHALAATKPAKLLLSAGDSRVYVRCQHVHAVSIHRHARRSSHGIVEARYRVAVVCRQFVDLRGSRLARLDTQTLPAEYAELRVMMGVHVPTFVCLFVHLQT